MRKLPRVAGAAAAVLTIAVTAGAFTFRPAGSAPAPARIRPGGPALLARGQHLPARSGMGTANVTSLNWGGYAASRRGTRFRYIRATFFVPYVDCTSTPDARSAHWVGLDGLRNNTVEQAGISADCNGSAPSYRAWYEMVPRPPVFQHISVRPGDAIVASVSYSRRTAKFTLSLADTTNGQHFRHSGACPARAVCLRAAAEAISEPPLGPGGYLPLANFRAEDYNSVLVIDQAGHRGGLRSAHWDTTKITTVDQGGAILDRPTALQAGSAFGTYWMQAK